MEAQQEAAPTSTQESATDKDAQKSPSKNEPRPASPPPNCAICLGECRDRSFTDSCFHQFCFECLVTWSKVKAECPLCKQAFKSIIYNVKSNHHYDKYMVETCPPPEPDFNDVDYFEGPRFRYRTTFTLQRQEGLALERLLMRLPVMPPPPYQQVTRRSRRNTTFRQSVYRHNLWANPLPDATGRHRECSPQFYRDNPAQIHRLMPWLRREFLFLLPNDERIISRILTLLPVYPILSTHFRHELFPHLGPHTDHFLHEFYSYASSPYDMVGYDHAVQYVPEGSRPPITYVNEILSTDSDSNDSDIVCIDGNETNHRLNQPSTSSGLNVLSNSVIAIETMSHSDSEDSSDEVVMVGYIKPPHERTPEVVDLASDSDAMVIEDDRNCSPIEIIEDLSTGHGGFNQGLGSSVSHSVDAAPSTSGLVKIKLKRNGNGTFQTIFSDTDSDEANHSVPQRKNSRPKRKRKKSRFSPRGSASTTEDTDRDTDVDLDVVNRSNAVTEVLRHSDDASDDECHVQRLCKRKQELASKILKKFKMGVPSTEASNSFFSSRQNVASACTQDSLPSTSSANLGSHPNRRASPTKSKHKNHPTTSLHSSDSKKLKIKGRSKSKEKLINKIFENRQVNDGTTKSVDSSKAKVKNKLFNKSFNKNTDLSLPSTSKASIDHCSSSELSDTDNKKINKSQDNLLDIVSKSILKSNNNLLSINNDNNKSYTNHNKDVPSNVKHILDELDQSVFTKSSPSNLNSKVQYSD